MGGTPADLTNQGSSTIEGDGGSGKILKKGVVVEVIYDPTMYGPEMQEKIRSTLNVVNIDRLSNCPRNSCIVRLFGNGAGAKQTTMLVFPFFPPHICLPVKPGEVVWLISSSATALDPKESFWISRISTEKTTDDINYTHLPRDGTTVFELPTSTTVPPYGLPNFTNNDPNNSPLLTPPTGSKDVVPPPNTFNLIVDESESYKNFTPQPVPKFSKRVGDLVLQGSNNTLISLGEDRGWSYSDTSLEKRTESNANKATDLTFAGTIDVVAGRSRYITNNTTPGPGQYATTSNTPGSDPVETGFRTIENSRLYVENDKNPEVNKLSPNPPTQGDPDFSIDAARLYVSMKTNGDMNFGVNQDITPVAPTYIAAVPWTQGEWLDEAQEKAAPSIASISAIYAGIGGAKDRMATGFEAKIEPINEAAYIIAKADEVRLIARKQDENIALGIPEINGSVRLIKEGKNSEDLAVVALLPDGTIQVSGAKIYLGRAGASAMTPSGLPAGDGGRNAGPGPGGSEPYVRYSDLKALWDAFMDEMSTFCDNMKDAPTPGYGHFSPKINAAVASLKAKIGSTHKPNISTVQSERIFGE